MFELERNNKSTANAVRSGNFFGSRNTNAFFGPSLLQLKPTVKLPEFSQQHFVNGNIAFFDTQYEVKGPKPAKGNLFISHHVHMNYPATMTKDERTTFENDFKTSVHDGWSNKHLLSLDEPGFSEYQADVDVTAVVEDDPKNAHTVIDVVKPKDEKRFRSSVTGIDKKEGTETTHTAKMDFRDPTVEQENKIDEADFIRQVGNFDFDSDVINADCEEDIQAIIDFINSIPAGDDPDCRFSLHYVGRASSQGSKAYNKALSEKRVKSVQARLENLTGLCLSITEAAGEEEAGEGAEFRRVNVGVFISDPDKKTKTKQNVAAHEFGHMIGLGDEYIDESPEKNVRKKFFGDNPTHYDAVKSLIDEEAADELLVQNSENIMSVGNDVKRGHYVMFVAAIDLMTRPEIEKATGNPDAKWKVE